jgi:hypothetical protein
MANNHRIFVEKTMVLLPEGANEALKEVSAKKFKRPAQYVREAILARLETDGICLVPKPAA